MYPSFLEGPKSLILSGSKKMESNDHLLEGIPFGSSIFSLLKMVPLKGGIGTVA